MLWRFPLRNGEPGRYGTGEPGATGGLIGLWVKFGDCIRDGAEATDALR